MAIAFSRYIDGTQVAASTTAVVNLSACAAGDLVFILISRNSVTGPTGYPSGWSSSNLLQSHASDFGVFLYGKVLATGENVSSTFTYAASVRTLAKALVYTGAEIKSSAKGTFATASGTTVDCGTITSSETWLAQFCSGYAIATRTYTALSGYTERRDHGHTQPDHWQLLADTNNSWGGGACAPDFTIDGGLSMTYRGGFIVELKVPAATHTGTSTFKVQLPTLSGTATNVPPARSATSTFKLQLPLLSGAATNTPAGNEADGELQLQLPLLYGTATNEPPAPRSADGAFKVQLPLLSGAATNAGPPRAADSTFRVQLPLLSGEATNVLPPRSADGTLHLQLVLFHGEATNVPPARSADGTLRLQLPLLSGTATAGAAPRSADASFKLQLPLLTGAATNAPPARTADGELQLQLPLLTGTASNVPPARDASGGLELQLPTLGGNATNTSPAREAVGELALQLPALGGTASNVPPAREAAGGLKLQLPTLSGAAAGATPEARTASGGLKLQLPTIVGGDVATPTGAWVRVYPNLSGESTWIAGCSNADASLLVIASTVRAFKSTDRGANWSELRPAGDVDVYWLRAACSADGQVILLGTYIGRLWLSKDGGATWAEQRPAGDADESYRGIGVSDDGQKMIVAVDGGRLYTTADCGSTWTERTPAGAANKTWYTAGISGNGSVMLAGIFNSRIYMSTDSGANWAEVQPAGNANKLWRNVALDYDGSHLVAHDDRYRVSVDSGANWADAKPEGDSNRYFPGVGMSKNGESMLAGCTTGYWSESKDDGATWTKEDVTGNGTTFARAYQVAVCDDEAKTLMAAVQTTTPYVYINVRGTYGPEWGAISIVIDAGAAMTRYREVDLTLSAIADGVAPHKMCFSDDGVTYGAWVDYATSYEYTLPDEGAGNYTVYVKYGWVEGATTYASDPTSDTIEYNPYNWATTLSINAGAVSTDTNLVDLAISILCEAGEEPTHMAFSADGVAWGSWETFSPTAVYVLAGQTVYPSEARTVYCKVKRETTESAAFSDSIDLEVVWVSTVVINGGAETTTSRTVRVDVTVENTASEDFEFLIGETLPADLYTYAENQPAEEPDHMSLPWTASTYGTLTIALLFTDEYGNEWPDDDNIDIVEPSRGRKGVLRVHSVLKRTPRRGVLRVAPTVKRK